LQRDFTHSLQRNRHLRKAYRLRLTPPVAFALAVLLAGCASSTSPGSLSVKDEMKLVVDPASTALFAVQGDVDPANGPDPPPASSARWRQGSDAAAELVSVARALQRKERAIDQGDWIRLAREMETVAAAAKSAADERNGAAFSDAVNALADNCFACHGKYKDQSGA